MSCFQDRRAGSAAAIAYWAVNLRDPAVPESATPVVRRLQTGEFDEGPAQLDVPGLARAVNLSVSRFAHLFREQLGVSPQQFVERRRLDAACRLLELTRRSIASIAAEVGYPDPLYFSTRFRRHTGTSPSDYRR
jgi:AraC-like DNA-binding protein